MYFFKVKNILFIWNFTYWDKLYNRKKYSSVRHIVAFHVFDMIFWGVFTIFEAVASDIHFVRIRLIFDCRCNKVNFFLLMRAAKFMVIISIVLSRVLFEVINLAVFSVLTLRSYHDWSMAVTLKTFDTGFVFSVQIIGFISCNCVVFSDNAKQTISFSKCHGFESVNKVLNFHICSLWAFYFQYYMNFYSFSLHLTAS